MYHLYRTKVLRPSLTSLLCLTSYNCSVKRSGFLRSPLWSCNDCMMAVPNSPPAHPVSVAGSRHSIQHVGPLYPLLSNLPTSQLVNIVPISCPQLPFYLSGPLCDTDIISYFFLIEKYSMSTHSFLLISSLVKPPGFLKFLFSMPNAFSKRSHD